MNQDKENSYEATGDKLNQLYQMNYRINILESILFGDMCLLKQPILKRDTCMVIDYEKHDTLLRDINNRLDMLEDKLQPEVKFTQCESRLDRLEYIVHNIVTHKIFEEN